MKQITCPHCGDTYPDFDVAHVCSQGPYAVKLKSQTNTRIQALIDQVGTDVSGKWISVDDAEKFAELIVRECVKFCEHESNDDEHDEYDMGMWVKAESIKTAIMEEFGIKE